MRLASVSASDRIIAASAFASASIFATSRSPTSTTLAIRFDEWDASGPEPWLMDGPIKRKTDDSKMPCRFPAQRPGRVLMRAEARAASALREEPEAAPLTWIDRPQQDRSRKTLERLLDATEEIIRARGIDAVTIPAVVQAAQSSVGSFYARFPTKAALPGPDRVRVHARIARDVHAADKLMMANATPDRLAGSPRCST